jgi:UDP-N-acetylmuramoyl-L-alanyl-D-glutamate--2,6-diaminopimelate ligase
MSLKRPRERPRVSSEPVAPSFSPITLGRAGSLVPGSTVRGDCPIGEVAYDSREVPPGAVFFCVPGMETDGHDFAEAAVAAGAVALVVQRWLDAVRVPQMLVDSVRSAMGPISAAVFGRPVETMSCVGITGTNGKTTITYLLESIFRQAGIVPGVIGTTGARIDGRSVEIKRTTPEAPDLHRLLAKMRDEGVGGLAMEVSSHALAQGRVDGALFDVGVFTNLTQDHLDYHADMQDYFAAKARFFDPSHARTAVVNMDDPWGSKLLAAPLIPTTSFAVESSADLKATEVTSGAAGIAFRAGTLEVTSRLRGAFNVSNCLAAVAAARALGLPDPAIAAGIGTLEGVPGRVEPVEAGQRFLVVVDYAHTPDSILGVLQAARQLTTGRVIVVVGCGGDRDRGKRPLMGAAATSMADLSILTSDNPRSEDPAAILADMAPGAKKGAEQRGSRFVMEPDRRSAIRMAVREAAEGDVVVIAGKGHETYQETSTGRAPFDDRQVARMELLELGGKA